MKKRLSEWFKIFVFILLSVNMPLSIWAFTPQPGSPLANHTHPRLHITQQDIPQIRSVLSTEYQNEYQDYVNSAYNYDDNDSHNIISEAGHDPLRAGMVHQAFIAAIGPVPNINYSISIQDYANRAITSLINRLNAGQTLSYVAALTYDWTYNYMTNSQRTTIANLMLNRRITHKVFNHSIAQPQIIPEQMFSSKYYEGCYAWYIALAFWGDGLIDAEADAALDTFDDIMLNFGYLDAENFVADDAGGWSEWIGYSSWHPRTHFLLVDGWRTATGEDYVLQGTLGNAIKNYPKFMIYQLDPHKYYNSFFTYIRMGDAQTTDASLKHRSMREQLYVLPRMLDKSGLSSEAGLISYIINHFVVLWPGYEEQYLWPFLGLARAVPAKTPEELNFKKSLWSKNLGVFTARTGFSSPADGVFTITSGHFRFEGHSGPEDRLGFGLAKFGTLVNTRNVSHRGYGNLDNYPGAYKENLVFFEGDHRIERSSIDIPGELEDAETGQGNYDHGGIEQVTQKENQFYQVRINMNRVLESGVSHTREYVWLPGTNPIQDSDFLVVYDRCVAPTKPHWIYHVPWKPIVSNYTSWQDISTGSGQNDRIGSAYLGSNIVIKELNGIGGEKDNDGGTANYTGGAGAHGVAFCRTILPSNMRAEVTRVASFDNDVLNRQGELAIKSHRWQIDVMPEDQGMNQYFLHVFQTADSVNVSSMTNTSLIEVGAVMQGVWIERENNNRPNYAVLFNKVHQINNNGITYTVNGNGIVKNIIVGLKPFTNYDIKDTSSGGTTTMSKYTESDLQLWDYKGVTNNLAIGVLFFENNISGVHSIHIEESGNQNVTPPGPPTGLHINAP